MADLQLNPKTALGQDAPGSIVIGGLTITERDDTALASLATRQGRAVDVARAAAVAGVPLPGPGRSEVGPELAAFWLGPDQWMIEAPFASHADIRAAVLALFGDAASVTEQTDAWVRFDLSGELPAVLERLTNFDFRSAADLAATRTVIDHLGCYLIRRSAQLVTIYGPRSSAHSLQHAMVVAAASVA